MMKHLLFAVMAVAVTAASAQTVTAPVVGIERETLGSGTPGQYGWEQAQPVLENDIFHAPQYLPYYPTAATIWPRVIEVPCVRVGNALKCEGYHFDGIYRAEYLFFTPKIVEPAKSTVVVVPGPVILKEVPVRKMKE